MHKYCLTCGAELQRKHKESPCAFRARRYCGRPCFGVAMRGRPKSRIQYLPTPDEIRAECDAIQAGWSDQTEQSRRVMAERHAEVLRGRIMGAEL